MKVRNDETTKMARNIGLKISYDPVWERVKEVTGWKKDAQLATFLKVQPGTISGARQRDSFPLQWAFKIAQHYQCSTDWLMVKEGREEATKPQQEQQTALPPVEIPPRKKTHPSEFDYVPMAEAHLSAGGGAFVLSEEMSDLFAFRKNWLRRVASSPANVLLMNVQGDSMFPTIQDGDSVLLDTGRKHIYDGNIYALRIDDTIVIKRLSLRPGNKILILSDNKDEYQPYEAETKDVHVLGQIIWLARAWVKGE